ncbi:MAG: sugar ABC transporter ATP-binding protein [Planctomycetota bacterium]
MPATGSDPILAAHRISQRFGPVLALDQVSLAVHPGRVLAVVGENGAGKSTLMKVLAGVQQPMSGSLEVSGRSTCFHNVHQAIQAGVVLIHQELNLATNLSVAANIFLGREPARRGWITESRLAQAALPYLERLQADISPLETVKRLAIGRQQLVEIAKALSVNARVVIMDEPTSSLSQQEAERLYTIVRQLRDDGVAIVYISHRLNEVMQLADEAVVLRDGRLVGHLVGRELDHDRMVSLMVGRELATRYDRTPHPAGDVLLDADGVRTFAFPHEPLSFQLAAGEIVGLAGLVGAGRTELLTTLFGVTPAVGGQATMAGAAFCPQSPIEAIARGVALAPEDRREAGLALGLNVRHNLSLASLGRRLSRGGFIRSRAERELAEQQLQRLSIKTRDDEALVRTLSGGNQQKVVLGKWLATQPKLMLLDEPTRGIDVGAKADVYAVMHQLAAKGVSLLFASSDLEEILGVADRVLVMHQGRIAGELSRPEMSESAIMKLAVGTTATSVAPEPTAEGRRSR